jgi:predicted ABC-type ATPase
LRDEEGWEGVGVGSLTQPHLIILAGPNGAGKSTAAPVLLDRAFGVTEFVNADVIASGLSAFEPERVAIEAGRIMLRRLRELADQRANFAFETTLAARSFAPWIADLVKTGYAFHLFYLWLASPEQAILRVRERVRAGGHDIPDDTIQRRYQRGLSNFFNLYQPLATKWGVYDSSDPAGPRLIAKGASRNIESVADQTLWSKIVEIAK